MRSVKKSHIFMIKIKRKDNKFGKTCFGHKIKKQFEIIISAETEKDKQLIKREKK